MRRSRVQPAQDAADLGQFIHQLGLVLKTPCSVHDQHVDAGGGRLLDRVEHDARRVSAFLACDDRDAQPLGPHLELADRRSAERIARRQHHAIILLQEIMREFRDGGSLARPIDADDQDDLRPGEGFDLQWPGDGGQHLLDFLRDDLAQIIFGQFLVEPPFGQPLAHPHRHGRAEVGQDQRFLDLVERLRVQGGLAEQAGEIVAELVGRALQTAKETVAPGNVSHVHPPSSSPRRRGSISRRSIKRGGWEMGSRLRGNDGKKSVILEQPLARSACPSQAP